LDLVFIRPEQLYQGVDEIKAVNVLQVAHAYNLVVKGAHQHLNLHFLQWVTEAVQQAYEIADGPFFRVICREQLEHTWKVKYRIFPGNNVLRVTEVLEYLQNYRLVFKN